MNIEAIGREFDLAISEEIANLRERLEWADRDPTIEEAMCFTDRDVAYILKVSVRSVSRYVERGDLRAIYLSESKRTRRFTLPDIKAFIRGRVARPD